MKVVLFLGAGFSKPFGLPVMNEFFRHANESNLISPDEKDFVQDLQRKTQAGASMLQGPTTNLEHVLSFSLMTSLKKMGAERPDLRFKSILQRIYSQINLEFARRLRDRFRELLGLKLGERPNYDLTVITTNYDLVADFTLYSLGLHPSLPFEWDLLKEHANKGSPMYVGSGKGTTLCKLHGSVNWFNGESKTKILIEQDVVQVVAPDLDMTDQSWHLPRISASNYFKENETPSPLIVPPTLYKQDAPELFRTVWDTAHNAIHNADRLTLIGYSFPDSDTHMRYFVSTALVGNVNLEKIQIIDPAAASIDKRLREADFGPSFKDLLNPVDINWQDGSNRVYL